MLKKLLAKKATLVAALKGILDSVAEGELLSETQKTDYKIKKEELDEVKSQIDLVQGFDAEAEQENEDEELTPLRAASKASSRKPAAIPGARANTSFESLDEWLETVIRNPNDARLEYREYVSEQRMDTGSAGGFAVPKQFLPEIREITPDAALVRPRASVIPAGSPPDAEITLPALEQSATSLGAHRIYGGVSVAKVAEGGQKPTTNFALREVSLKPYEIAGILPLTEKLLRNWQAASNWAAKLLRSAIIGFEDDEFLTGNGIAGPEGVLDCAAAIAYNRAVSSQIAFADVKGMFARFRGNEANAVWGVSYSAFPQLLNMVGDGGGATNIIKVDSSTGQVSIYGIPVKRHAGFRALGQRGDLSLTDLSNYLIKDGSGPLVEVGYDDGDFRANKRSMKITWNVDGKAWLKAPYKDRGADSYEVSPFIVLDVPSGS